MVEVMRGMCLTPEEAAALLLGGGNEHYGLQQIAGPMGRGTLVP